MDLTHEKVRFRRDEIADLDGCPSAAGDRTPALRKSLARRASRWLAGALAATVILAVILAGVVLLANANAVGSDRLRDAAQKAIADIAGFDVTTQFGDVGLVLGRTRLLALEMHDVRIARAQTDETMLDAGMMRFGIGLIPLLSGRIDLGSATIEDARLYPARLRALEERRWNTAIVDDRGLVDPALVTTIVFDAVRGAFDATAAAGTERVRLTNVSLVLDPDNGASEIAVPELTVARSGRNEIAFQGGLSFRARALALDGHALRSPDGGQIEELAVALRFLPGESGVQPDEIIRQIGPVRSIGALEVSLTGGEDAAGEGGELRLELAADDLRFGFGEENRFAGDANIAAAIREGVSSVEISRLRVGVGRSVFNFRGTLLPVGAAVATQEPAYRFELASLGSTIAPADSPEPSLPVDAQMTGRIVPATGQVVADLIGVRTVSGELVASAALTFEEGKTPGLALAVSLPRMATGHVKQLWPWFAGSGAREWMLANVFGGWAEDSRLDLNVPPGRFGNGIPLSAEEVSGHFKVNDTRFDVAGRIPPVRDAAGAIDFRGTDIDIALSSGTIYMPSGRSVAASDGTLAIRNAHVKPRIGKLEIDVRGKAPAIVELSSYEPIDASRFHDLTPEDVTGDVSGHVSADIPLQDGIPAERLGWRVTLDYEDLSLAKPVEGQTVTDATGSLIVEPQKAEITAQARLNGIPSRLDIVEPLGGSDTPKKRDVELQLDNAARDRLLPGLSDILSGTSTVRFEDLDDGRRKVNVKLDSAVLSLPWIGWRKGAGIPATASFVMETEGQTVQLEDFRLSGQTFAASGSMTFRSGSLSRLRFADVRLNRGDALSVAIDRSGGGYAISARGKAFDARSLVKRFLSESTGQAGTPSAFPVTVKAEFETVSGFGGETFSNVSVDFRGNGPVVDHLVVSARTDRAGEVSFNQGRRDGRRIMRLQATDAGSVLRFTDLYAHMEGGSLDLSLAGDGAGTLRGQVDMRDFWVVNEPRLGSLVAAAPENGRLDATRVRFDRGYSAIEKGSGNLNIKDGVLRGPVIGTTFQGMLYDASGAIAITGTFMPIYGLNRIFGEIPLFGQILGNGRDRGLIGITYRLYGKADDPQMQINPISAIAPGIFRQIFEFR